MVPTGMIGVDKGKTPEVLEQGEESVHTNPLYAELFPQKPAMEQPVKIKPRVEPPKRDVTAQPRFISGTTQAYIRLLGERSQAHNRYPIRCQHSRSSLSRCTVPGRSKPYLFLGLSASQLQPCRLMCILDRTSERRIGRLKYPTWNHGYRTQGFGTIPLSVVDVGEQWLLGELGAKPEAERDRKPLTGALLMKDHTFSLHPHYARRHHRMFLCKYSSSSYTRPCMPYLRWEYQPESAAAGYTGGCGGDDSSSLNSAGCTTNAVVAETLPRLDRQGI